MDARTLATVQAAGRLGFGVALTVAPERTAGAWVGRDAWRPASRVLAVGLGARDAALGAGTLAAVRRGDDLRPWLAGGMACDLADLLVTLASARHLPPAAVAGVGLLASGSVALGAALFAALE